MDVSLRGFERFWKAFNTFGWCLVEKNVSSNCRQVEEDLFILSFQKLAVTAQMSGTSGHRAELPENLRNFRKTSGTSRPTSSDTLKGFAKTFWCAR